MQMHSILKREVYMHCRQTMTDGIYHQCNSFIQWFKYDEENVIIKMTVITY